jgi:hypothetical protein
MPADGGCVHTPSLRVEHTHRRCVHGIKEMSRNTTWKLLVVGCWLCVVGKERRNGRKKERPRDVVGDMSRGLLLSILIRA